MRLWRKVNQLVYLCQIFQWFFVASLPKDVLKNTLVSGKKTNSAKIDLKLPQGQEPSPRQPPDGGSCFGLQSVEGDAGEELAEAVGTLLQLTFHHLAEEEGEL